MTDSGVVLTGFLGSLCAGLATGVGAAGVFVIRSLSEKLEDILLSLAAGIMLAATVFSLLLPALEIATEQFAGELPAVSLVSAGLLIGAGVLHLLHRSLPHEHFVQGREGPEAVAVRRIWLFVIAITLHNVPEGMAVGVGFGGGGFAKGLSLAIGIGLQNVPEGLAVAVALVAVGYGRMRSFLIALASGLVEPLGGLFGSAAAWLAEPALPLSLGFAAGAMLFIISDEIIPETHRRGFETQATFSLLFGFVLMMFLDVTLG
ncbi:MAG: ZIP family metal transporter [Planctomycetota bacterium]